MEYVTGIPESFKVRRTPAEYVGTTEPT